MALQLTHEFHTIHVFGRNSKTWEGRHKSKVSLLSAFSLPLLKEFIIMSPGQVQQNKTKLGAFSSIHMYIEWRLVKIYIKGLKLYKMFCTLLFLPVLGNIFKIPPFFFDGDIVFLIFHAQFLTVTCILPFYCMLIYSPSPILMEFLITQIMLHCTFLYMYFLK